MNVMPLLIISFHYYINGPLRELIDSLFCFHVYLKMEGKRNVRVESPGPVGCRGAFP